MRACLLAVVIAALAPMSAFADTLRVLLADPDPELRRAVEAALAPWQAEVVVDGEALAGPEQARPRADAQGARFVVWRRDAVLFVYDRERSAVELRPSSPGAMDRSSAAAAALTVKTLMRLPPPPPPVDPPTAGAVLRVQAGAGARWAEPGLGGRVALVATVRPWFDRVWRFGLGGEVGTRESVSRGGFKGSWTDWGVQAVASASVPTGRLELEPYLAIGAARSVLEGAEMSVPRDETALLVAGRGGCWVRASYDRWSAGASVSVDVFAGAPTYTRSSGMELFAVPTFAFSLGIFAATDIDL